MPENLVPPPENDSPIRVSPIPIPLTVEYVPRSMRMHSVSSHELDTVASLSNTVHLCLFGLCAGAAVTCGAVLTTANITDPKTYAGYVAALIMCGVLSLYFGIRGCIDYHAAKKKLKELKGGR